jgi:hypothetical protein
MSEVKFRLQIQPKRHILDSILGLPPIPRPLLIVLLDHILDPMAEPALAPMGPWLPGIAPEAFGVILQMGHNAVALPFTIT